MTRARWKKEPGEAKKMEVAYGTANNQKFMRVTDQTGETPHMHWFREGNDLEQAQQEYWVKINSTDLPRELSPRDPAL